MSVLVHEFLSNNYKKHRDNLLIKEKNNAITHQQLELKSNQFANYLTHMGLKKGDRVIVIMEPSINAVISLLGMMKNGIIFVPVNVKSSFDTLELITTEVEPSFFIIDDNLPLVRKFIEKFNKGILVNNEKNFTQYENFEMNLDKKNVISKDILNIIYTSGSTGKPKGVMISHENVVPFMEYVVEQFDHNSETKTLSKTPLSFDPFLTEVVPSFISGGTVYLYKDNGSINNFLRTLEKEEITNFGCGPSLLNILADNTNLINSYNLSALQEVYFGYENCPIETIQKLQAFLPHVTFINGYGTTETYACSTFYKVENLNKNPRDKLPLGDPIKGTELTILNDKLKIAEVNEVGEMVIRSNTIMKGYWKNEERTLEVLRPHPLYPFYNEKVYFTGDLVKKAEDGNIYFIGRKDDQVKVNGYRIELNELKIKIESIQNVKESSVLALDKKGIKKLVCYITVHNNFDGCLEKIKKDALALIDMYKYPTEWYVIDEFPRNLNSKIDKKKLKNKYLEFQQLL
ncbi:AMP-binding protein [Bacillus weihaiensis]|uniref:AMP-binding protein n=1 Tax=Bacillus weihaiensis TaxID=1547283 RepID=UPI0023579984|nr:AMP-binding protein [Bacillus weihaiensis]